MDINQTTQFLAGLALAFCVMAFTRRLLTFKNRPAPAERARPRGSAAKGVAYAFTLGMAPWAKESTRRHWLAYTRGVAFHLGIFLGLGVLLVSPWMRLAPAGLRAALGAGLLIGAGLGLAGFAARFLEPNLKALSTLDDYFAVLLVSLFLASGALWMFAPPTLPFFYFSAVILLVYAPLGKIRHCIYYAYSRLYYGLFVGRRAVLPHTQQGKR